MNLKVKLMDGAPMPVHAKSGDAGLDLTSREDVMLLPGETKIVGTGVAVEIPQGYFGLLAPRSGLASKRGITFANTPGIIDSGYRGEIKVPLRNINPNKGWLTKEDIGRVERGERVCQLIIIPCETCECVIVDDLSESERGESGFGSSGRFIENLGPQMDIDECIAICENETAMA